MSYFRHVTSAEALRIDSVKIIGKYLLQLTESNPNIVKVMCIDECEDAFKFLKDYLRSAPVQTYPQSV